MYLHCPSGCFQAVEASWSVIHLGRLINTNDVINRLHCYQYGVGLKRMGKCVCMHTGTHAHCRGATRLSSASSSVKLYIYILSFYPKRLARHRAVAQILKKLPKG